MTENLKKMNKKFINAYLNIITEAIATYHLTDVFKATAIVTKSFTEEWKKSETGNKISLLLHERAFFAQGAGKPYTGQLFVNVAIDSPKHNMDAVFNYWAKQKNNAFVSGINELLNAVKSTSKVSSFDVGRLAFAIWKACNNINSFNIQSDLFSKYPVGKYIDFEVELIEIKTSHVQYNDLKGGTNISLYCKDTKSNTNYVLKLNNNENTMFLYNYLKDNETQCIIKGTGKVSYINARYNTLYLNNIIISSPSIK